MKPLLSIAIPTKNRYFYLEHLIKTLSQFDSNEFEVVIQDNSVDNSEFINFIDKIDSSKIRYFHSEKKLSQTENCELALENSNGEYVCMIGDDDGVVPSIFVLLDFMKNNGIDGAYIQFARYIWPDTVLKAHNFAGKFYFNSDIKGIHEIDAYSEFIKSLRIGGLNLVKMPKVYHGIISKRSLDEVKKLSGSYFPGPSPDMANAVALSFIVKNYIYCDIPVIISGMGYNSVAGAGARKKHVGKIEDIPHLPKNTAKYWEKEVPKIWTGQTIYAESFIKSVKACKKEEELEEYNYNKLYASFICFHFDYVREVTKFINLRNIFPILYHIILILSKRFKVLILNYISTKIDVKVKTVVDGVSTIDECVDKVEKICKENLYKINKRV